MRKRWLVIGLLFLGLAVYAAALKNHFLWDDEVLILQNPLIRSAQFLPDIFGSGYWSGSGSYYRPLCIASYLVDYKLWGFNPFGFILTNMMIHLAATLLLFLALARQFRPAAAFWVAAIYCVHPVQVASVAPAFGRAGLLEAFVIGSFLAFQAAPKRWAAGLACAACYAAALLAKESALIFPAILWIYGLCYFTPEEKKNLRWLHAVMLLVALVYVAARWRWIPFLMNHPLSVIAEVSLPWRIWTWLKSLVLYLGLLLFPWCLHTEYQFAVQTFLNPLPWIGLVLLIGGMAYAFRTRTRAPHLLFGLSWFLLGLLPTANLMPLAMTMAEHWLYLPIIGLGWILAGFLDHRVQNRRMQAALALVVTLLAVRTVVRIQDWRDGITLYRHDLRYAGNSMILHNNLGVELYRQGQIAEAEREFAASCAINPRYGTALNNLGAIYEARAETTQAEQAYRAAIASSQYELAYANLARVLLKSGRADEAMKVLAEGLIHYPYREDIQGLIRLIQEQKVPSSP